MAVSSARRADRAGGTHVRRKVRTSQMSKGLKRRQASVLVYVHAHAREARSHTVTEVSPRLKSRAEASLAGWPGTAVAVRR